MSGLKCFFEELLKQNKEYAQIEKSIIDLEKELFEIAPDNIINLYHQIDFFCCKQREIVTNLLIKY